MAEVLMLLSKQARDDIRVKREAGSLLAADHSVSVIDWRREPPSDALPVVDSGLKIISYPRPCRERSFISFLFKLPLFWLFCLRRAVRQRADVVHAHDLDTLPIALIIARLSGSKLLYDAHESYSDMIRDDAPWVVTKITRYVERRLLRQADLVIVANAKIAELIGAERFAVVMNCPRSSEIDGLTADVVPSPSSAPLRIGYFGSLEPGRFLEEAVEEASRQDLWELVIAGEGTLAGKLAELARRGGSVTLLGPLSHERTMEETAGCDLVLVMFDPSNANNLIGTPNRLFEAMALGVPAVVTEGTYSAEIAEAEGCGFSCEYSRDAFLRLLARLIEDRQEMQSAGRRGRLAFEREYNWEMQTPRLLEAYARLSEQATAR